VNAEYARTLIDYHITSNNRLWECIMALTEEQFIQPCSYSYGSVRDHAVHMASTDLRWLARLQGTALPDSLKPADYPTREAARAKHDEVAGLVRAYAAGLDDDLLNRPVIYDMPHRGGQHVNPAWQVIAHVVNHCTDHRAQVLRLLYDLGAPTFEQDLIIYLWNK
jgi:uncharacterized damage-inducible protein DinB